LKRIFCVLNVAEDMAAEGKDHRTMSRRQVCKRRVIALLAPTRQQGGIR
jgi:hypothetical protein